MKFIHTADWQLGMRAAHVAGAAEAVRAQRLASAREVVARAQESGAEFMLIAGDLFEDNRVDSLLVQQAADLLGAFPAPVYLIPGNHDPLVAGSVWEHPAWKSHPNVSVLTASKKVELPWGDLFPCPLCAAHGVSDPTRWIEVGDRSRFRIGLAHGTVAGLPLTEPDYPIARDAATRHELDYLALGHWHSMAQFRDRSGICRMAYAGTHETSRFGERDSGWALLVDIKRPGDAPSISPLRTGGLAWETWEENLIQEGDLRRVRERLEAAADSSGRLLDLRLQGFVSAEDRAELDRLSDFATSRFLFARINASALRPRPEDAAWIATLPLGPVRDAAAKIQQLVDPGSPALALDDPTPEVAVQALLALYQMTQPKSRE